MVARVIDRDLGWRALLARAGVSGTLQVTVGIHADEGGEGHGDSGLTVAAVAAFHEFGFGVPQRSWLRDTIDAEEADLKRFMRQLGKAMISNRRRLRPRRALELFGLRVETAIRKRIRDGIPPELAPATVAAKGSTTPLIDTGQTIQSIASKVTGRRP